jgi:mercuric ion binding protein
LITGVHHEKAAFRLALAAVVAPVWAATQTVTLSVPGMTCSACPITVKKAISKVDGVSKVDVTRREAVVTFDDAKTSVQKLTKATEDAGYHHQSRTDHERLKTLLRVSIIAQPSWRCVASPCSGHCSVWSACADRLSGLCAAACWRLGLTIYAIQRKRQAMPPARPGQWSKK